MARGHAATETVDPDELSERARHYLQRARKENTRKAYKAGLNSLTRYGQSQRVSVSAPVRPIVLVEWITHLADKGLVWNTIENYLAGVAAMHRDNNMADPTKNPAVALTFKGIVRDQGGHSATHPRFAVTKERFDKWDTWSRADLTSHRRRLVRAMGHLAYYGLMRNSELLADSARAYHPRIRDVTLMHEDGSTTPLSHLVGSRTTPVHLAHGETRERVGSITCPRRHQIVDAFRRAAAVIIHLGQSKTDTKQRGVDVVVDKGARHALADLIIRHPSLSTLSADSPLLSDTEGTKPMTRRDTVPELRDQLIQAGVHVPSELGLSFRAGGATRLGDMGIPDHLIKVRGRWTSDCYQRYIRTDKLDLIRQSAGM